MTSLVAGAPATPRWRSNGGVAPLHVEEVLSWTASTKHASVTSAGLSATIFSARERWLESASTAASQLSNARNALSVSSFCGTGRIGGTGVDVQMTWFL